MHLPTVLALVISSEEQLADSLLQVANKHDGNAGVRDMGKQLAGWSRAHVSGLAPFLDEFGRESVDEPQRVRSALFHGVRLGGFGLLRDLQDLAMLAKQAEINWTSLLQAVEGMHRQDLTALCTQSKLETGRQLAWLETQIKQTAPQAINVSPDKAATAKASIPQRVSPAAIPELLWSPVAAGALMILVGVTAWMAGKPWLIPSLGPTAYLQAETPAHPSTRFYNTVTGHLIGLSMGFLSVMMFDAWQSPSPLLDHQLGIARVWASGLALSLTILVALLLKASHPPAGATTLLVSLGALRTRADALSMIGGVLLVAVLGEVVRKLRLKTARAKPR
jgi:hypothetical protein